MIVFDLACELEHVFEGWFSSAADFEEQSSRGQVRCPLCDSGSIHRRLSAPRLNFGAVSQGEHERTVPAQHRDAWLQTMRHVIESAEDVGDRFTEEARRIHYQEAPVRGIRGTATRGQADELAEEGVEFYRLALPPALKGPLQ